MVSQPLSAIRLTEFGRCSRMDGNWACPWCVHLKDLQKSSSSCGSPCHGRSMRRLQRKGILEAVPVCAVIPSVCSPKVMMQRTSRKTCGRGRGDDVICIRIPCGSRASGRSSAGGLESLAEVGLREQSRFLRSGLLCTEERKK